MSEVEKFVEYVNKQIDEGLRGISAVTFIDKEGNRTDKKPIDSLRSKQRESILDDCISGKDRPVVTLEEIAKEMNYIFELIDTDNHGKGFKPYTDDCGSFKFNDSQKIGENNED